MSNIETLSMEPKKIESNPQDNKDKNALQKYKTEYRAISKASKKDPTHNQERLKTKSEIAHIVTNGDPTLEEHAQKIIKRLEKNKNEDGLKSISHISEGEWHSDRREPSMIETVLATKESDKVYRQIVEDMSNKVLEIMRIGSSYWGRNFSVRGKGKEDKSDIDLDIIVDKIPDTLPYLEAEETFIKFNEYLKKGEADYCVVKIKINEIDVSFHFVPTSTLKKVSSIDYTNINQSINLKEFRMLREQTIKPKTYVDKNFAGESFSFLTKPKLVDGGQISEIPLATIGPHGELILGVVLNRYLPLPALNNNNELVNHELNQLIISLRHRKKLDEQKMKDKSLSFVNCHSHGEQMPQWAKDELIALD